MPQHSLDCTHQNVLLPTSCYLVPFYWKTRLFSHLAYVVWFAYLKWFKIKWVQTIHLHGVYSCVYTNRHGSHVSIFSKRVSPKIHQHGASSCVLYQYDSNGSATSMWYYHYYLISFGMKNVYHHDRDSINHSFRCKTIEGIIQINRVTIILLKWITVLR